MTRRILILPLSLALCVTATCSSSKTPHCKLDKEWKLDETPLTTLADVELLQAGNVFVLAGVDGNTVRWATFTPNDGKLGTEKHFDLPATRLPDKGPWFALTGKGGAANQLLALYLAPNMDPAITELTAMGQDMAAPRVVYSTDRAADDTARASLLASIRVAAGSARDGMAAVVAVGFSGSDGVPIKLFSLGGDAASAGTSEITPKNGLTTMKDTGDWDCMSFGMPQPGKALALSWVRGHEPDTMDTPWADVTDIRNDASVGSQIRAEVAAANGRYTCNTVPSARGYFFGYQNRLGTYGYYYDNDPKMVDNTFYVAPSSWGGISSQPPLAGIAAMGFNTAVVFARKGGPLVRLYDYMSYQVGNQLVLPASKGDIGPMYVASDIDILHATYREGVVGTASTGPRHFVTVSCPEPK